MKTLLVDINEHRCDVYKYLTVSKVIEIFSKPKGISERLAKTTIRLHRMEKKNMAEPQSFVERQVKELLKQGLTPLKISKILNVDFRVMTRLIDKHDNQESDINEEN